VAQVAETSAPSPSGGLSLGGHIRELDGFRAIAVLAVVLHHAFFGYTWRVPRESFEGIPRVVLSLFEKGWVGVDLFFVLSGLLITGILLDSKGRSNFFRNFYARRTLRIIPIYYLVITISWWIYGKPAAFFLMSYVFMANVAGPAGIGVPHGPGVFWSLAIEEHFYLIWPLIVWFTGRRTLTVVAFSIVVLTPVLRAAGFAAGLDPEAVIYPLSPFRFDGLAAGALLAIWLRSPQCTRQSTLRLAGILLAAVAALTAIGYPFGLLGTKTLASTSLRYTQMTGIFAASILFALANRGATVVAPLRNGFMKVVADLSYCMYLIHLIIGDVYFMALDKIGWNPLADWGPRPAFWFFFAVMIAATFGLAALSKKYVETPVLRLKRYFPA